MTVTYDADFTTDRDKVRSYIRDTVEFEGPLPDDENFSDAEIAGFITAEGSWQRAVAAAFESLAAAWITHPTYQADNMAISNSHIARNYQQQAEYWRKRYGPWKMGQIYPSPGNLVATVRDEYTPDE